MKRDNVTRRCIFIADGVWEDLRILAEHRTRTVGRNASGRKIERAELIRLYLAERVNQEMAYSRNRGSR